MNASIILLIDSVVARCVSTVHTHSLPQALPSFSYNCLQICGMLKSVLGLSSAVLAVLFQGLFGAGHVIAFLMLVG
jgi:hypothetical protein